MRESSSAAAPLVSGPLGIRLWELRTEVAEDTRFADAPLTFAFVALYHRESFALVRVRSRDCWELPGGGIEPGETPRQAAARELWEESGQLHPEGRLRFVGFARTELPSAASVSYGALFAARTEEPAPFVPNSETSALHWFTGHPPATGQLQDVDVYLGRLCAPYVPEPPR